MTWQSPNSSTLTPAGRAGVGKCYDNAPMERLWATLKTELIANGCIRA